MAGHQVPAGDRRDHPDVLIATSPRFPGQHRRIGREDHHVAAHADPEAACVVVAEDGGPGRGPGVQGLRGRQPGIVAERRADAIQGGAGDHRSIAREGHRDACREQGRERQEAGGARLPEPCPVGCPGPGKELGLDDGGRP